MKKHFALIALALTSVAVPGTALAQTTTATATAELNIRSGPGPHYPSVGFIAAGDTTLVDGCLQASKWCQVNYDGVSGWSYSDYLTADLSGQTVVLTERYADVGLATVTYQDTGATAGGAVAGTVTGAVAGALIAGPVGAAVGGAIGAGTGATAGAVIDPPEVARTYVTSNPVDQVYLDGEVVIGAGVPETVTLQTIPDYNYRYVYINGQPVLVDPSSRQIVYVVR
ncbi:Uncharacterized conserved protein YraI [Devosia crocina]|uniref:Uncharacterized conserved protein YraI n=1 Tax=Devosia crocina TaxID=429728 RepID=A0A1I7NVX8_9HYPH|nr:DUF1236 domain-containing protein [Devosia crocina]SFV38774.1 Uncharacterized conserved protein YraI [Devosia crocina]